MHATIAASALRGALRRLKSGVGATPDLAMEAIGGRLILESEAMLESVKERTDVGAEVASGFVGG